MTRVGAIDVGSNGIRLLIAERAGRSGLREVENKREGIRLGQDVFSEGRISSGTQRRLVKALEDFQEEVAKNRVESVRAVGTSALREAENRQEVVRKIQEEVGWTIEIIRGEEEARLVHRAVIETLGAPKGIGLLIDIGGGSLTLSLSSGRELLAERSLKLGAVRLLRRMKERNLRNGAVCEMVQDSVASAKRWIERQLKGRKLQWGAGTGGNIECLGELRERLLDRGSDRLLQTEELSGLTTFLLLLSPREREERLKLRPDRADVIAPAAVVLTALLSAAGLPELSIPHVGLKEGLAFELFDKVSLWRQKKRPMRSPVA